MPVYIQSTNQISAQKPLSDEWFDHPVYYEDQRMPTINPDFTGHFPPLVSRRMCVLLKRAVIMSRLALKDASVEMPDAIISGTGLGCIENTEKFLHAIMENDEKFLQPTYFMQSTHNILSSTIAIDMKCHGYNNTYVHRGASFENALLDAVMQFEQKRVQNVLVGGYDELTDDYYQFFDRIGIWDFVPESSPKKKCFASEAAVSMLLGATKNKHTICEINDVGLMHKPTSEQMRQTLDAVLAKAGCGLSDIDAVLTGLSTHAENDRVYHDVIARFFKDHPIMQYKHLFGESFSSSAIGVYVATTCLRNGRVPSFLLSDKEVDLKGVKRILVYNHYRNKSHSFILLSSCSN
ncbi:MAG: beta-ketoacyl synthase chain length factor [Tannerella sp.]|jgi:3-oxoacyl-(acyl-carrier-protein) synthase|nr:beta-ketoacyl synthase chain length factor [Tannerella sp.]